MFFNIQRWSLHDGSGIRTTVFFKGCPLRCRWCSNPESWEFKAQLFFRADRCSGCRRCMDICPAGANSLEDGKIVYHGTRCIRCGGCVDVCPGKARALVGEDMPVERVIEIIERDAVFYRSTGGGVTFSGGEPFAQPETLRRLARGCSMAGIPTAVETSGFFPLADAGSTLEWIDDIFIDLKHTSDGVHQQLTGVSNQRILENIMGLDQLGRRLTIRIPLIKNLTDTRENMDGVLRIGLCLKNLMGIELMAYHGLGACKYDALGIPYDTAMAAPDEKTMGIIRDHLTRHGLRTTIHNFKG